MSRFSGCILEIGVRYLTKGHAMLIFSHCHWGTADTVFFIDIVF